MATIFSTDHNCLVLRAKTKEGLPRELRFWAERGLIHCEDSTHNDYRVISVRTFLHRVKAHCDMLGRSSGDNDNGFDASFRLDIQRMLDKAIIIAELAQQQGTPDDASARRDFVRRRPKTIVVTDSRNATM